MEVIKMEQNQIASRFSHPSSKHEANTNLNSCSFWNCSCLEKEMQKCLTDNVVTANDQGCPELEEQSAGANSPQEVTGLE